jgi:uncharacterized protein YcbX
MTDWTLIRERYLKDGLSVRLGGLAANLGRVRSFGAQSTSGEAVRSRLEESAHFIEWTAPEASIHTAAELIELQVELARWRRAWPKVWSDPEQRKALTKRAAEWSQRVLELSGLLASPEYGGSLSHE